MEKLLHERLRNWVEDGFVLLENGNRAFVSVEDGRKLADEIERYYIPRPRFEDGEPVQFKTSGKDILWDDKDSSWKFNAISEKGVPMAIRISGICARAEMTDEGFVKRPTPKVYDADGVEIKVGDTVWSSMYGDNSFTVERISKNPNGDPLVMVEEMGSGLFPATCYHERPVFDAEGERIRKGDTVWHTLTGDKHIVEELTGDGGIYIDRSSLTWGGDMFTHREPDSLEKLLERMEDYAQKNEGYVDGSKVGYFSKELRALIERGA